MKIKKIISKIKSCFIKKNPLPVHKTPHGFSFRGPEFLNYHSFECEEQSFVVQELPAHKMVVNIGANIGFYACLALHFKKSVIAYEPIPKNCELLLENVAVNGWQDQCRVYQCALGRDARVVEIFGEGTGASLILGWAGGSNLVTRVPQYPLNDFIGLINEACLFIVDVEGFEFPLLQGAEKILQQEYAHTWLIEISINQHQPTGVLVNPDAEKTFKLMKSFGYSASYISGEPIPDALIADWQNNRCIPNSHNFVFSKK